MKKFKIYLLLALALIIQSTIIRKFSVFGVFPNLVLVLVFSLSIDMNRFDTVVFAFVSGLALDFLSGKIIGLNAILITYIAFLISYAGRKFLYGNTTSVFVISFLMTVLYQGVYVFLNYIIWNIGSFSSAIPIILTEAVYNSVLSVLVYYFITKRNLTNER